MRTLLFLALLASGCASQSAPESGNGSASGDVVSGTVASVDLTPWTYDGDGVIVMTTASGESVRVLIPARMNLCEAEGLVDVNDLGEGDRIEVVGATDEAGAVRPCVEPTHRVTRL
ncbi:hypothetical protein [Rubricoccus marinus]|uniref:DUF5666 domain-containing protein n=1 Tax=Rubricoccus marinus TaxID=716817 RepID=A0A259TYN5_9BACT|nr:hypothetical protein [Rubricoccus marinus]OZC02806.1 hypothetical protein BSZ36_07350 [Rubricoccus marinus]